MAKVKGLAITRLSGSAGNLTFRTVSGETVISSKIVKTTNRRTQSQQEQRMILRTVSAAYKAMKGIADHSFEGVTVGAKSMAKFMKLNMDALKGQGGNFNAKANPYAVHNKLILSQGSLSPSFYVENGSDGNMVEAVLAVKGYTDTIDGSTLTVQQFHDFLGINVGDQITLCFLAPYNSDIASFYDVQDGMQASTKFMVRRLIFKPEKASLKFFSSSASNPINSDALEPGSNVLGLGVAISSSGDDKAFSFTLTDNQLEISEDAAVGVIISRKEGSTWLRSNCVMSATVSSASAWGKDNVLPTYDPNSDLYLNEAV